MLQVKKGKQGDIMESYKASPTLPGEINDDRDVEMLLDPCFDTQDDDVDPDDDITW